jgi:hypothetical protein
MLRAPPPPQVSCPAHVPQLSMKPPQPSPAGPQLILRSAHVSFVHPLGERPPPPSPVGWPKPGGIGPPPPPSSPPPLLNVLPSSVPQFAVVAMATAPRAHITTNARSFIDQTLQRPTHAHTPHAVSDLHPIRISPNPNPRENSSSLYPTQVSKKRRLIGEYLPKKQRRTSNSSSTSRSLLLPLTRLGFRLKSAVRSTRHPVYFVGAAPQN